MNTQDERTKQVLFAMSQEFLLGDNKSVESTDCLTVGQSVIDQPDVDYTDLKTVCRTVSGKVQKIIETENTRFALIDYQWICLG